jgi:hypothetical protein
VMALARLAEGFDDAVTLARGRIDRHEVVVMQVHPPGTGLAEQRDRVNRRERRPDDVAEGVASAVADGPQSERELVLGAGHVSVGHWRSSGCKTHDYTSRPPPPVTRQELTPVDTNGFRSRSSFREGI